MGNQTVGDQVKLRAFCKREENVSKEEKRVDLKRKHSEILHTSTSRRLSQTTVKEMVKPMAKPSSGTRNPILRFDVHWKHFVKGLGYKPKKSEQGGGVQTLDLPR